ncbi:MAG: hypothetical protein AB7K09_15940 [Planctomycetota bacterium]
MSMLLKMPGVFVAFVVAGTLVSCVSLEQRYPERRFFVIDATTAIDGEARVAPADAIVPAGTVLKVRPFTVSPAFAGQEFTYRTNEATWETDYYNTFLIPPGQQIADQAQQLMSSANIVEQVVTSGSYVEPTHLLEGHVVTLHGDFRDRKAPLAVLELQLFLVEIQKGSAVVRLRKNYQQRVPIDVGDYSDKVLGEALLAGWNLALRRILTDFAREVREAGAVAPPG